MKIKQFAAASVLSLSLVACTEGQPKISEPKQEASMAETEVENREPKLDFEYVYDKTNGKQRFSRSITKEEEDLFYDQELDREAVRSQSNIDKYRFNRKLREPKLSNNELRKRELRIQKLLDECVALVGPEPDDARARLDLKKGSYSIAIFETFDDEYVEKVSPSYLSGRMSKCVRYLYISKNGKSSPHQYDFSDFEYQDKYSRAPENSLKKQKIEKIYEQIYLEVKEAGLLRKIFYTYYPKSFLREHADQTGLTQFIHTKEAEAGKPLKHDELAAEFFGSREKWINSFDEFLEQKITNKDLI